MSEDKPKRKRPDRAESSKIRRSLNETVVKVSLPGLLVPQGAQWHERPKSLTRINGSEALKLTNFVLSTGAIGSTAA